MIAVAFNENTVGKVINIGDNFEIPMIDLFKKIIDQTQSSSTTSYVF